LRKLRGECSDRVRIFQELYKKLIYNKNLIEPNLAKVGAEGSNPFARSNVFNDLGDTAFAAQSGLAACFLISVLIRTPAQKSCKFSV
jgi:hypothetical protein